jgi:transposase
MKRDKYMGMDVHQATTVVAVIDAEGKIVLETIVPTAAGAIRRLIESISGPLHVTLEETTQAEWLHDMLQGFVTEVVVCDPRRNRLLAEGSKADKADARKLAELLRTGMVRSVWHGRQTTRGLKEMVRAYETFAVDTQRTMMRIKALYRSRGIATQGSAVYQRKDRDHWLKQLIEVGMQQRAAWLYEQLDHVRELRKRAKAAVLIEGQRHRAVQLLRTIPQVGPVRAAQIVATAGTPHRFRTKRQFWSYSGLAVVTHTSAEYELRAGRVVRRNKPVATGG